MIPVSKSLSDESWGKIPDGCFVHICDFLPVKERCNISEASKFFYNIINQIFNRDTLCSLKRDILRPYKRDNFYWLNNDTLSLLEKQSLKNSADELKKIFSPTTIKKINTLFKGKEKLEVDYVNTCDLHFIQEVDAENLIRFIEHCSTSLIDKNNWAGQDPISERRFAPTHHHSYVDFDVDRAGDSSDPLDIPGMRESSDTDDDFDSPYVYENFESLPESLFDDNNNIRGTTIMEKLGTLISYIEKEPFSNYFYKLCKVVREPHASIEDNKKVICRETEKPFEVSKRVRYSFINYCTRAACFRLIDKITEREKTIDITSDEWALYVFPLYFHILQIAYETTDPIMLSTISKQLISKIKLFKENKKSFKDFLHSIMYCSMGREYSIEDYPDLDLYSILLKFLHNYIDSQREMEVNTDEPAPTKKKTEDYIRNLTFPFYIPTKNPTQENELLYSIPECASSVSNLFHLVISAISLTKISVKKKSLLLDFDLTRKEDLMAAQQFVNSHSRTGSDFKDCNTLLQLINKYINHDFKTTKEHFHLN